MQTFARLKAPETLILRVDPESSNLSGSTMNAKGLARKAGLFCFQTFG